jgi:endonuclease-3
MDATAAPADRLPRLLDELAALYGPAEWRPSGRPLEELLQTILSQHTSDLNSGRAYRSLVARFPAQATNSAPSAAAVPDFVAIRDAPLPLLAEAIRSGGLAEMKAARIQAVLRHLSTDAGPPRLLPLADLPLDQARARLTALPGIGPKTAACVLLFAVGLPDLPVDTHVHRVSRRLGLIDQRQSAEAAHGALLALTPAADRYRLHVGLIRHGHQVCKAPTPRCQDCRLRPLCPYPSMA